MASVPLQHHVPPAEAVSKGVRADGRGLEEFRRGIFLDTGTVTQASGSAYIEFDATKIAVAVHGPRESTSNEADPEQGTLKCDVRFASFATRRRKAAAGTTQIQQNMDLEREMALQLRTALAPAVQLTTYPNSTLDITCLILESGGSELALTICAASLALADAGIQMHDLVSACGVSRRAGQLLLDPTTDEAFREDGSLLLAMMVPSSLVANIILTGEHNNTQLTEVIELGMGGCEQVDVVMRQCLRDSAAAATESN